jgi:hypothetical protein
MHVELDELFDSYDFGYDLDLISADDWEHDSNHHYRSIYLENKMSGISTPISAIFHVYLHGDGSVREIVVETP